MLSNLFLDTNIFIYYLQDRIDLEDYVNAYDKIYYSFISKIELLSFSDTSKEEIQKANDLISSFSMVAIDEKIINETIHFRRKYRLKVPDAIVVASANVFSSLLLTNDAELMNKVNEIKIISPFGND